MTSHHKVRKTIKNSVRTSLGLLFIVASTFHFTASEIQLKIIPPFLPLRKTALYLSGIFELIGGYGLLLPRFKRPAAWGLAALLLAIVPANIYHASLYFKHGGPAKARIYHYVRMPLQALLILIVLWSGTEDPKTSF